MYQVERFMILETKIKCISKVKIYRIYNKQQNNGLKFYRSLTSHWYIINDSYGCIYCNLLEIWS